MILYNAPTNYDGYRKLLADFAAGYSSEKRYVFLVSDRYTLQCERDVLSVLGRKAVLNVDVVSFQRFASKKLGNITCLSPEGAVLLLSKVLYRLSDTLSYYRGCKFYRGIVNEMYSIITAIRASGITEEAMRSLLSSMKQGTSLYKKTQDIYSIYTEYVREVSLYYDDGTTRLEKCADYLQKYPCSDTEFFVTQFSVFNAQQLKLISILDSQSPRLSVSFAAAPLFDNDRIYPMQYYKKLRSIGEENGNYTEVACAADITQAQQRLAAGLFSYSAPAFVSPCAGYTVTAAYNGRSELEYVASRIRDLVSNGVRFKEIGVVLCDKEEYKPYIEAAFVRRGIPCHYDLREGVTSSAPIRLVLDALALVEGNLQQGDYLKVLKNFFVGIPSADCFAYENFILKYNVNYTGFLSEFTFGTQEERAVAEPIRLLIAQLIQPFSIIKKRAAVGSYVGVIRDFLLRCVSENQLAEYCKLLEAQGLMRESAVSRQVMQKLSEMLDTMCTVLGETEMELSEFLNLLQQSLSTVKVSLLPISIDNVIITDAEGFCQGDIKHLFIVGASTGSFPADSDDSCILSLKELEQWSKLNCPLSPNSRENNMLQRFHVLSLFLAPMSTVSLSYSSYGKTADGGIKQPSIAFKQTAALLGVKVGRAPYYRPSLTFYGLQPKEMLSFTHLDKLFFGGDYTNISQLENYFRCPFAHFLHYGLSADKRPLSGADSLSVGNLVHSVMEGFFKLDDYANHPIADTVSQLFEKELASDKYSSLAKSNNFHMVYLKLLSETERVITRLMDYEKRSDFRPEYIEINFGKGNSFGKIYLHTASKDINLAGKIDRVDSYKDRVNSNEYVIILDYKTGATKFSTDNVYYGTGIQLFVYMSSLINSRKIPVGVFLVPIRDRYQKDDTAPPLFDGLLTSEEYCRNNFDSELDKKDALPLLQRDKKGQTKSSVSPMEFKAICRYAVAVSTQAAEEILEGYVAPSPIENVCGSCDYRSLCNTDGSYRKCSVKPNITSFNNVVPEADSKSSSAQNVPNKESTDETN